MFKNQSSIEEEKVDIPENIIPYESNSNNSNYNLNNNFKQIMNTNRDIISTIIESNNDYNNNSAGKNLKKEDFCKETINIHTNKINQTINNDNIFKTLKIDNKINKTDNKNRINLKNLKVVTMNKDDLYNAFLLFQQLISKYENENNVEFIKNKLFEFVSMKKINFTETIDYNEDENDNENIFDIQNYMPIYCKTERDINIDLNNNEKNNKNNLVKNYSFSFSINDKNKILNNYTFLNDPKESIKNNSLLFSEYLLFDKRNREKTISPENSKSFHHNYSFDLKNRDKNELSFNSMLDKEKEKDKDKDKYFMIENYDILNNHNSYEKEIEHNSPFNKKNFRLFTNNIRNYSTEEDLLAEPINKNNKISNISNYNDNENNKYILNKNISIKEKVLISPTKPDISRLDKLDNINKENNKCNYDLQPSNTLHEIKVNKNKSLNNKEQFINEKIKELNEEIKKFKEETNKVILLKEEYEKMQEKLEKDVKEFNLKKQITQKNYKGTPQSEVKLIMSITQHNQALILNNNKKKETIKLLKERISELENIIKSKNNYEHINQKNVYKKLNNFDKHYYGPERINIFTKKRNIKKNNESYLLKRARNNLKKNIESNSSEKIKGKINSEIINQTMNNHNPKPNNNKQFMNISYNIKNSILNSKLQNYNFSNNNNYFKKYCYNANSNKNFNKKNSLNNNTNILGNNRNNSINSTLLNNKLKMDNPVIHTNLYIYEKLINKEREKEKNYKRINIKINSERDLGYRRIIKELKTETEKNKNEKDKKSNNNLSKKYQKSQGKNILMKKLDLKADIFKNKSNINILSSNKANNKYNSINKKSLIRNTTNFYKNEKYSDNTNNNLKEINNSLNIKNIKRNKITESINKNEFNFDDGNNINKYDFIIPEIYKKNKDAAIINTVEQDGKKINIYDNKKKEIIFKSGVRKEIFMDGYQLVYFPNGDMKQKYVGKEEKVIYFYNETNTVQTTFKNGLNIFKFNNGQIEKHYPDGSKFIIYTNGIKRKISKSGREELFMPNEQKKNLSKNKNDNIENETNRKKNESYIINKNINNDDETIIEKN